MTETNNAAAKMLAEMETLFVASDFRQTERTRELATLARVAIRTELTGNARSAAASLCIGLRRARVGAQVSRRSVLAATSAVRHQART